MFSYQPLFTDLADSPLKSLVEDLPPRIESAFNPDKHGDLPQWLQLLEDLPDVETSIVDISQDQILIGVETDCSVEARQILEQCLHQLHPWRKGPFSVFGIDIDTEWRSDWKWQRLEDHISSLQGRLVLDVGCGNGYHCWRMAAAGARQAIGIDPSLRYVMQYLVLNHYAKVEKAHVLPLGIEDIPSQLGAFDTVFSMGVLYHRRSPLDHLIELRDLLRRGGELVLETLVIEGGKGQVLLPPGRYAKMRNVWFLPTVETLELWLARLGFKQIRTVDVTVTSTDEQRSTDWMVFESLTDYLDPQDQHLTAEGHPAPIRAVVLAEAP